MDVIKNVSCLQFFYVPFTIFPIHPHTALTNRVSNPSHMKTKLTLLAVITGLTLALPVLHAQDAPPPSPPPDGGGCQNGGHHCHHGPKPSPSPTEANQ
jgi:hypothetical protein